MDDPLEAGEVRELDVADVLDRLPRRLRCLRQPAVAEVADVEPGHVVAGGLQFLGEDRTDISQISGDQQFHRWRVGLAGEFSRGVQSVGSEGDSSRKQPVSGLPRATVSRRCR